MTRSEIVTRLREDHKRFAVMISSQTDQDFLRTTGAKWSVGHQLDHIYRSVSTLRQVVRLPVFLLRLSLGKANRPSRSYEEVIARYQERLSAGGKAMGRYIPGPISIKHRNSLLIKLTDTVDALSKTIEQMDEEKLDMIVLPHPLLGRITLREMLYFTIYHVGHHHKMTIKNLGK